MTPQTKCLILNICSKRIDRLEHAKLIHDFLTEVLMDHARDVCDAYNVASEGVSVNYRFIDHTDSHVEDYAEAITLIPLDDFIKAARNFIEEGLFTARRGHVCVTGNININFNTVFISTGSVMITQEIFR